MDADDVIVEERPETALVVLPKTRIVPPKRVASKAFTPIKYRIFIVGGHTQYAKWTGLDITTDRYRADLIMLTGGTDINPQIYEAKRHPNTEASDSGRDTREMEIIEEAMEAWIPLIGICRGAQLLCAVAGGKLVQHQQDRHPHDLFTRDGKKITVGGQHHQAAFPWGLENDQFRLLGHSLGASTFHEGENCKEMAGPEGKEAEIVYYPQCDSLGIQSHPEWAADNSEEVAYCKELMLELLHSCL